MWEQAARGTLIPCQNRGRDFAGHGREEGVNWKSGEGSGSEVKEVMVGKLRQRIIFIARMEALEDLSFSFVFSSEDSVWVGG